MKQMTRQTLVIALCATTLLSSPALAVEPVVEFTLGAVEWPDQSNDDEVEANADKEIHATLSAGVGGNPLHCLRVRGHVEASFRGAETHGRNLQSGTVRGDERGYVLALLPHLRVGCTVFNRATVFLEGGIGPTWQEFYGDRERAVAAQGGAGISFALSERWSAVARIHYFQTLDDPRFRGARGRYNSVGGSLGFSYSFGAF